MRYDNDAIRPYFTETREALPYRNMCRMMGGSLEDKPFPQLPEELHHHTF